jgi:hypothetical protein
MGPVTRPPPLPSLYPFVYHLLRTLDHTYIASTSRRYSSFIPPSRLYPRTALALYIFAPHDFLCDRVPSNRLWAPTLPADCCRSLVALICDAPCTPNLRTDCIARWHPRIRNRTRPTNQPTNLALVHLNAPRTTDLPSAAERARTEFAPAQLNTPDRAVLQPTANESNELEIARVACVVMWTAVS